MESDLGKMIRHCLCVNSTHNVTNIVLHQMLIKWWWSLHYNYDDSCDTCGDCYLDAINALMTSMMWLQMWYLIVLY
jgi:hypothetical protein